jgi:hypothetical protein
MQSVLGYLWFTIDTNTRYKWQICTQQYLLQSKEQIGETKWSDAVPVVLSAVAKVSALWVYRIERTHSVYSVSYSPIWAAVAVVCAATQILPYYSYAHYMPLLTFCRSAISRWSLAAATSVASLWNACFRNGRNGLGRTRYPLHTDCIRTAAHSSLCKKCKSCIQFHCVHIVCTYRVHVSMHTAVTY